MSVFEEFAWRGMVYDATEGLAESLACEKITGYIGFDPTAPSLHVGSLLQIISLARMQRFGHSPIALVGGGTGMIGDPSGKSKERVLLTEDVLATNLLGIRGQLERFLDFTVASNPARVVDNGEWLRSLTAMELLRDIGKHFSVNAMLAKESVRRRIEGEDGISFTEFSYSILQSYDFMVLYDRYGCRLQMGGSDQWGNITAGVDLIRRLRSTKAHGMVFPLVTTASGQKFGKTEQGTIWLDAALTSPYRFYQFWINTGDADVIPYLKQFTWLDRSEIEALEAATLEHPERRGAQERLAREVTSMVHGPTELEKAERATQVLFGAEIDNLPLEEVLDVFAEVPSYELPASSLAGMTPSQLFADSGAAASRGEARRLLSGGGLYLNNRRLDEDRPLTVDDALEGAVLVLRKGKKGYHLVKLVGETR